MPRPPLPAGVIALRGNASKLSRAEVDRRRDPARPLSDLTPPDDLTKFELELWREHVANLTANGLLTVLDPSSYRLLVVGPGAIALEALDAMRPKKTDGSPDRRKKRLEVIVPDRKYGGWKRNPAVGTYLQALKSYEAGCRHFGLTPSARVSLRAAPPEHDDDDSDLFE